MNDKHLGLLVGSPKYTCPVHGNIGNHTMTSTIPGHEMDLCLICYMEKLVEIGVCKVELLENLGERHAKI